MYIMHNSVCITSPSFFLLRPVVQEKMVKTHRERKNSKSGSTKFGALYTYNYVTVTGRKRTLGVIYIDIQTAITEL